MGKIKSAARNSFFYSLSNMLGKLSGLILLPLYTVYLSVDMFGLYSLFELSYQVIVAFTGMGIRTAMSRWYWDKGMEGRQKELFYSACMFNAVANIATMVILYLGFDLLAKYYFQAPVSQELRIVFIAGTLVRLFSEMPMLLLRVTHKAFLHTVHQFIQLVVFVGLTAYFLAFRNLEIYGIFLSYLISYGLNFVLLIPYMFRNFRYTYLKAEIKDMLAFGMPLAGANIVNMVLNLSDRVIINFFGTLKSVGNYSLAYKIANVIDLMIVSAFMKAYTHLYYKGMNDVDSSIFFTKILHYLMIILAFVSMCFVVLTDYLALLFSWGDYRESLVFVPVLTLSVMFSGLRSVMTLPLSKVKKTRIISMISLSAGIINIVGNIALVPFVGAMGAAISTLFTQFVTSVWMYKQASKYDTASDFGGRNLTIIIGTSLLYSVVAILIKDVSGITRFASDAFLILSWPLLLYALRIIDKNEILILRGFIRKWRDPSRWKDNLTKELKEID